MQVEKKIRIEVRPTELTSVSQLDEVLQCASMSGKIAIDTETTGLRWAKGDRAFMATFATDVHHSWLCYDMEPGGIVHTLLQSLDRPEIKFIAHNLKFDLHMLRETCGWVPRAGYSGMDAFDTMLGFRVLDPLNSAALKVASARYLGTAEIDVDGPQKQVRAWISSHTERERIQRQWVTLGIRLDEDTPCTHRPLDGDGSGELIRHTLPAGTLVPPHLFNYSMVPRRLMDVYASQDVVLTIASHHGLTHDLAQLDPTGTTLIRTYDRMRHLVGRLIKMELYGWPLSAADLEVSLLQSRSELDAAMQDLNNVVGLVDGLLVGQKAPMPLNPFSAVQLTKYLYSMRGFPLPPNTTDKGNPTVDEAALTLIPDAPLRDAMLRIRHWKKSADKDREIGNFLSVERGWAYVHGSYNVDRARTGRLSASDPQLHNMTRRVEGRPWTYARDRFKPAPGKELLFWDFSNIEMRIFALYAQDPTLLEVFLRDGDAHLAVAAMIYGKPEDQVTKTERLFAKTLGFSILYGGGVNRIYDALRYSGAGDALTEEEMRISLAVFDATASRTFSVENGFRRLARYLVDAYYKRFPTVRELNRQTSGSVVDRWDKYGRGFVRNLYGREVLVPKERAHIATNALIQSTAADLFEEAIMRVDDGLTEFAVRSELKRPDNFDLFGNIHDEMIAEHDEGLSIALATIVEPLMVNDSLLDAYVASRRVKIPGFQSVPIKVEFAVVRQGSDWGHKEKLELAA